MGRSRREQKERRMRQYFSEPSILSANLCTESSFATTAKWTNGSGWTYDTPVATTDGTADTITYDLTVGAVATSTYTVTIMLVPSETTATGLTITLGGTEMGTTGTATGMFTITGVCGAGTDFVIDNVGLDDFIGDIGKVSIKRHL